MTQGDRVHSSLLGVIDLLGIGKAVIVDIQWANASTYDRNTCIEIKNIIQVVKADALGVFDDSIQYAWITINTDSEQVFLFTPQISCPGGCRAAGI